MKTLILVTLIIDAFLHFGILFFILKSLYQNERQTISEPERSTMDS